MRIGHTIRCKKGMMIIWGITFVYVLCVIASFSTAQEGEENEPLEGANETNILLLPGNIPLELIWIPAGSFTMGRFVDEQDSEILEDPQHKVLLKSGFYIGKYEVTQAQWQAIMGTNPSHFVGDTLPVEQVSWNDVQGFIKSLNTHIESTGQGLGMMRLPTEAEWEYACRSDTKTRFYWGDDLNYSQINDYAWYSLNGGLATHPVGEKLPNAWGLYDMSGNAWEWCQDWSGTYPGVPTVDPKGPYFGTNRVFRGGSWYYANWYCRSATRGWATPDISYAHVGFRIVKGLSSSIYHIGDANLDGAIDIKDVTYVLDMASGTVVPEQDSESLLTADVNWDGNSTSGDALAILLFARSGGLITNAPTHLTGESGGNQVTLFWDPVTHANLAGYAVYRREEGTETYYRLGDTAHTVFTDTNVETKRYEYYVVTRDIFLNEGPPSGTVAVLANTVRIWLPEVWGMPGTQVRIPINFGNARGIAPKSMIFNMTYDPNVLTFTEVQQTVLTQGAEFMSENSSGMLQIISITPEGGNIVGGEGRFLDLVFDVNPAAASGCTDLTLERATLMDTEDNKIATAPESGRFCAGDTSMWGDVNQDTTVSTEDVQMLLDIVTQKIEQTPYHQMAGNLNGDGRLDSADAVLIQRMIAGLPINPVSTSTKNMLKAEGGDIVLSMPSLEAHENEQFMLPITLSNVQGLAGMDLVVSWPAQELRFDEAQVANQFYDANNEGIFGCFRKNDSFNFEVKGGEGYMRLSMSGLNGLDYSGELVIVNLTFTVLGKKTDVMNPAPVVRINYADVKRPYGESHLWFGDVIFTQSAATITILEGDASQDNSSGCFGKRARSFMSSDTDVTEAKALQEDTLVQWQIPVMGRGGSTMSPSATECTTNTQTQFNARDTNSDGSLHAEELGGEADKRCGCCKRTGDSKDIFQRYLGDWLLIGLSAMILLAYISRHKQL